LQFKIFGGNERRKKDKKLKKTKAANKRRYFRLKMEIFFLYIYIFIIIIIIRPIFLIPCHPCPPDAPKSIQVQLDAVNC
jgi:hypothetical protein